MNNDTNGHLRPGLLVSVRNAEEALAALAGGANVIDVKEPERGSLGAADAATIEAVVGAVNQRAPVTAAMGELKELVGTHLTAIPGGVSLFKIGLAGCCSVPNWRSQWREVVAALLGPSCREGPDGRGGNVASPAAVAYADWRAAGAPEPDEVLKAAIDARCPALLVDTWDKSAGSLFDHWPPEELGRFVRCARSTGLLVVLAGSLANEYFSAAVRLGPDLVAVRAAACKGGRRGTVCATCVQALQQAIQACDVSQLEDRRYGVACAPAAKNFLDNGSKLRILETT